MHRYAKILITLVLLWNGPLATAEETVDLNCDVAIYGATPSGIASAISLARRDRAWRIVLVTPYKRVGGLITNGLSHPDFRTFEARTGLFREFNRRVEQHYREQLGPDSQQVKESLRGTHAGPELNHTVLRQMLDLPGINILTQHRMLAVSKKADRITSITLGADDSSFDVHAKFFVDASYEGDLMAAAGVPFHVGREAKSQYGESLAPEATDDQVQGYNFRLTMTDVESNRASVPKPKGYNREDYLALLTLLNRGAIPQVFGDPYAGLKGGIYKRQTPKLPNGKRDINDVSRAAVRLSLPNINNDWPAGGFQTRQEIFDKHVRHNVGMLYFLQNDPEVPSKFADETRRWGFCRDELTYNNHLPEQLYVREARRMIGRYVFTQTDVERAKDTHHARAVFQAEAIAMGDYGPNCHGTFHEGPLFGGRHTGEFYRRSAPYQIPFGTLLPKELSNLAVPVACSSSHVGFCALRLEPIWMSLGQASGEAIGIALEDSSSLQDVSPSKIRSRLHATGTATIYTSDVAEESADFRAVQWWGSLGGLVALDRTREDEPADYGQRGKQVIGQYFEAFPEHALELDKQLDQRVKAEWTKIASKNGVEIKKLATARTRGDFIRVAWRSRSTKVIRDVVYAKVDGQSLRLDLYVPATAEAPPLVVWIHGGGWRAGSRKNPRLRELTHHGYALASISYRFTDKAIFPAQIHDCKAAIRWLRAHADRYGYNPDWIAVAGSSAGGHLALLVGVSGGVDDLEGNVGDQHKQSSRVQAIIDYFGPSDFVLRGKTQPDRAYTEKSGSFALLGGLKTGKITASMERFASPAHYVSSDDPPLLAFHGTKDKTVLLDQGQRIASLYEKAGRDVQLVVLKGAGHGGRAFFTGEHLQTATSFLNRHRPKSRKLRP